MHVYQMEASLNSVQLCIGHEDIIQGPEQMCKRNLKLQINLQSSLMVMALNFLMRREKKCSLYIQTFHSLLHAIHFLYLSDSHYFALDSTNEPRIPGQEFTFEIARYYLQLHIYAAHTYITHSLRLRTNTRILLPYNSSTGVFYILCPTPAFLQHLLWYFNHWTKDPRSSQLNSFQTPI